MVSVAFSDVVFGSADEELTAGSYRLKTLDNCLMTGPLLIAYAQELIYKHTKGSVPPVI
jgi:hypothetical protein